MRFDSLILELQTEIRAKNSQLKETWRQFEEAVATFEKISSVSTDIPESVDEEDEEEEEMVREEEHDEVAPRQASAVHPEESENEDDYYEKSGLSVQDLSDAGYVYETPTKEIADGDLYNNYLDKSLVDRSHSATTDGESPNATIPISHSNTYSAPVTSNAVVIPEKKPSRPSIGNERTSIGSIASSKLLSDSGPKRKAQSKCKRLQHLLKALEASIAESQYKLVFTREDYQRSLQALDDLEDELCTISTRFEENQKMSLGHFFSALQNKQDQSIIEVYKDLKEYKSQASSNRTSSKRKRHLEDSVSLLAVGPDVDDKSIVKKARTEKPKSGRSLIKTFFALSTVTALAAATGIATGYFPSSF